MSEMHLSGSVNRARRNNIPSGEEIRFALRDKRDVANEKLTRIPGPDLERDEIRSNGDREGTALPLPLAGEGWGGGAAAIHAVRVERISPTRIASFDAMRPPPQAGEVQKVRGQADSTKNHHALERHLSPHGERIELRARVAEIGGADLLGNVAVKVVEHQPDVAVGVPVQRQRIDRLSPASDAVRSGELIVKIDSPEPASNLPCSPPP